MIEPGKTAPAFSVPDQNNVRRTLKSLRGQWVVLYFYPKDNTPGCTTEACRFRDNLPKFTDADAVVFGISPDDAASHTKFIKKFELPFDLLADTDRAMCEKYGVWQEKTNYGKTYMGVVRTTYLIDPAGKVARRWDKVKVDGHDEEVLSALQMLRTAN